MYSHLFLAEQYKMDTAVADAQRRSQIMDDVYIRREEGDP